jgi:tetratricopeptide (TPR) repeat protein
MLLFPLMFGLLALGAQGAPPTVSDDLAAAKALYASAAYQEALTRLAGADASRGGPEVDQYRALCLLALGRTGEAQKALEQLVTRQPLFKMSDTDVSPRLIVMFHDVRKRLLPAAGRSLYATAKASFEEKDYAASSAQLKELLALLADDDLAGDATGVSDLKMLGEGFLKLAEAEVAASAAKAQAAAPLRPANSPAAATPPPAPVQPASSESSVKVYSDADPDVTPPVDVARNFPPWHPPNALAQRVSYRGILKVVIDERGKVESAVMVLPVSPAYDPTLLLAAKAWQFRPALKGTEPVKYQKLFSFTLTPR